MDELEDISPSSRTSETTLLQFVLLATDKQNMAPALNGKNVFMGLLTFTMVGFVIGFLARPVLGNEWERLRPIVYLVVASTLPIGVFVVACRGILQRRRAKDANRSGSNHHGINVIPFNGHRARDVRQDASALGGIE